MARKLLKLFVLVVLLGAIAWGMAKLAHPVAVSGDSSAITK